MKLFLTLKKYKSISEKSIKKIKSYYHEDLICSFEISDEFPELTHQLQINAYESSDLHQQSQMNSNENMEVQNNEKMATQTNS